MHLSFGFLTIVLLLSSEIFGLSGASETLKGWGKWSKWSKCKDCTKRRHRICVSKGVECTVGDVDYGTKKCAAKSSCQTQAQWGEWVTMVPCTKTCGGGQEWKLRHCLSLVGRCHGLSFTQVKCNSQSCPVHGQWSGYSQWSSCDKSCREGHRKRTRSCNNPKPSNGGKNCTGFAVDISTCSAYPCPVHGAWTEWHPGTCTKSCGKGTHKMTRYCSNPPPSNGGRLCSGPSSRFTSCCLGNCPDGRQAYTGSYSAILYRQVSHPVYRACGWLWRSRCLRHTTYSGAGYYVKKYGTRYRSVPGETCA